MTSPRRNFPVHGVIQVYRRIVYLADCTNRHTDVNAQAAWLTLTEPSGAQPGPIRQLRLTGERLKATVDWVDLIRRVATDGDRNAFARLFEHFGPRLKGFLIKTGSDPETAEDIAQSTFVAVWRKAGQFDPASSGAAAWIFTIARNQRIDAARRSARQERVLLVEAGHEVDTADSPEQIHARNADMVLIMTALARLSEEQSTVVRLSFIEEKAHGEIASSLGIPLGTVKSRIRLAMDRLRTLLDEPT